ncbi:hypothetical protein AOL_s00215g527 [Orbilia oligospora ATCC 24927]|uniref:Uncharacterized protein n=1 Tax=Arthrobotrys oligospora (strain ATCC 24927 / CBS 115.81 / DSM 1491) TaxID=756982 RepID=G1XT29_ARTOA|nr:hypothetical protein AOL_s00215g527 [Orbilia oligospora ATCC 24927]EGX43791.1 hypothetical protein AOL_s00215g527 [Orbilia oligospora ATCC 24927]
MKPQQISSVIYGDTTTTTAQRQQRNNNTNNSSNSTSYSRSSYYNGSRSNYASRSQAYYQSYPYYRSNSTSRRMDSGGGGAGGSGGNLNNSNGNDGKGTNGGSGGSMSYSTGSGPYDDDFGFMESQRGILLETQFEGVTEEIDLDKEGFERQELKELRRRDQVIFAIDAYQIWEQSRYHRISRGRPGTAPYITAWPMKPYTLPVFLMIGFAATSIIINFITTVVSCCTCRRLPHKDGKFDVFSCVATSILTALWGLAAGLYHGLKKGKDLYSYSCSRVTLARTRHFPSIDFDSACNMHQMVLWASIAAFVINTLALGEIALVVKRRSIRKDMGLLEKLKV